MLPGKDKKKVRVTLAVNCPSSEGACSLCYNKCLIRESQVPFLAGAWKRHI